VVCEFSIPDSGHRQAIGSSAGSGLCYHASMPESARHQGNPS
jgi:hypothetical protein